MDREHEDWFRMLMHTTWGMPFGIQQHPVGNSMVEAHTHTPTFVPAADPTPAKQHSQTSGRRHPEIGIDIGDRVQAKSGGLGDGLLIQKLR